MNQKSIHSEVDVKSFAPNHKKHEIVLRTYGKPFKDTSAEFKAKLTEQELCDVCDFVSRIRSGKVNIVTGDESTTHHFSDGVCKEEKNININIRLGENYA